jgi:antitoxin component of MazEF toxin-antitoxin module
MGEGTQVDVAVEGGRLVLTPVKGPLIEELARRITADNRHPELDWGGRQAHEAW